ncbi:AAA family ATPase, partial [Candidatus Acetothermia bacterium]|nr:AAA family ATPase [Candidatus Acetothermia bacterium]
MLRIQLLGPFRVWKDEHEITAAIRAIGKADTLLKVLLSEPGRNFNRDELIECLWGEEIAARKTTEKTAAGNLRRRVSAVRKLLEPASKENPSLEYILTTADGYRWNFQADYHLDVEEFFQKYERAKALQERKQFSEAVKPYEAARQLVHGDYLENDRYAEWANPLRQRWHETNVDLLERLAECYARLGQYRHAIDSCRAVLELEAARESAYRQLMLYQYLSGNQSEALTTYETCMKLLKARGVATLDPQTKQLADQIRARHILGIDKLYTPTSEIRTEIPYTLSPGSIPFVGREKEFAELVEQLKQARRGDGCCVLVSGEAGVGKTRLV